MFLTPVAGHLFVWVLLEINYENEGNKKIFKMNRRLLKNIKVSKSTVFRELIAQRKSFIF